LLDAITSDEANGFGVVKLLASERGELFFGIRPRVHLRVGLCDPPLFINDIGDPAGVLVLRAAGSAVGESDGVVGVGEKRKREVELLGEAGVLLRGVEADAEDLGIL
jgi:hypothetical protein